MPARLSFPPTPAARAGPPHQNQTAADKTHASLSTGKRSADLEMLGFRFIFLFSHDSLTDCINLIIQFNAFIHFTKCNRNTSVMSRDMGVRTDRY